MNLAIVKPFLCQRDQPRFAVPCIASHPSSDRVNIHSLILFQGTSGATWKQPRKLLLLFFTCSNWCCNLKDVSPVHILTLAAKLCYPFQAIVFLSSSLFLWRCPTP
ncbi:hypothetical protein FKM82_009304 [Ascaphus truei]